MTITVKILSGGRYTLWNVTEITITQAQATIKHTDRKDSIIQGYIESIKRVG